jgi:hypothetical protein
MISIENAELTNDIAVAPTARNIHVPACNLLRTGNVAHVLGRMQF